MFNDSGSEDINVYNEDLNYESLLDLTSQNLLSLPVIQNDYIRILYLQNNNLTSLSDEFFPSLPSLMWLDIRDNKLLEIPTTIKDHKCLTHLLLKNNKLTTLPFELGTCKLKALQLGGNPLIYPPSDIINKGVKTVIKFLNDKYLENSFEENFSNDKLNLSDGGISYNSVLHEGRVLKCHSEGGLSIKFNEKESSIDDPELSPVKKIKQKCPKLTKSRLACTTYSQSSKYLRPIIVGNQIDKIRQNYLMEVTKRRHMELLANREKIIQGRKNIELLKNWSKNYKQNQVLLKSSEGVFKMEPNKIPYDVNPEYMTLLSRDDIERDLPNKYKKRLLRKSKPTVPRKSASDVQLAMKIKELFANLESIDLKCPEMTPRTEQKMLLNEIQKISEIKHKLQELSFTNNII